MPFGIGQFQNGDSLLGAVVGGGQVATLIGYAISYQEADDAFLEARETIQRANAEGTANPESIAAYRQSSQEYIESEEEKQTMLLAGFGLLWAAGVTHAILTQPTSSHLSEKAKKTKLRQSQINKPQHFVDLGLIPTKQDLQLSLSYKLSF